VPQVVQVLLIGTRCFSTKYVPAEQSVPAQHRSFKSARLICGRCLSTRYEVQSGVFRLRTCRLSAPRLRRLFSPPNMYLKERDSPAKGGKGAPRPFTTRKCPFKLETTSGGLEKRSLISLLMSSLSTTRGGNQTTAVFVLNARLLEVKPHRDAEETSIGGSQTLLAERTACRTHMPCSQRTAVWPSLSQGPGSSPVCSFHSRFLR
jgi:hypothetical protein